MALRLTPEQYYRCPAWVRRVVGSKLQLLVKEVGSGRQRWLDVELTSEEKMHAGRQARGRKEATES